MEKDKVAIKEAFAGVAKRVNAAEILIRSMGLNDLELRILAERLLQDED